jgi:Splicing factor 3B subunit 10 (SF3b10)
MLLYAATAEGASLARMRHTLFTRMISPCGPAPTISPAEAQITKSVLAALKQKQDQQ